MNKKNKVNKKEVEASDTKLELFKKQHGLETDFEAYEFLKKSIKEILGVIP